MTLKLHFPYLLEDRDRHGNQRFYVRVAAGGRDRKRRIREAPGTPEFMVAYTAAVEALKGAGRALALPEAKGRAHGSLGWLAAEYFGSAEFMGRDPQSRANRRGVIEGCLEEPIRPKSRHLMRDCPIAKFDATHVMMLRDRKVNAGLPGAANNRRKYLGAMFSWAIEQKRYGLRVNPCRDARRASYASSGFYTWTADDVRKFVERHPIGTQAYLAFALMLFLGARRGDAIRLGPANMRDGTMVYVPRKTSYRRLTESVKPILPPLAEAIRRTPYGLKTFLITEKGIPFTDAGFGNRMRGWCDQADLPECTAHGLKKIAATICADLGATDRMMMALFDWTSEKQATAYTEKANKTRLAAGAAALLGTFSWERIESESEAG